MASSCNLFCVDGISSISLLPIYVSFAAFSLFFFYQAVLLLEIPLEILYNISQIASSTGGISMAFHSANIDRQLRFPGRLIRIFLGSFTPFKVKVYGLFLKAFHLLRPMAQRE